jgi:Zn-dependent peptidase ImmA (M78 family)
MIGKRLKLARAGAGLSLRDLEKRMDNLVSAQAIGKYERDEMMPGSMALMTLAKVLDVSETYLLGQGDIQLEEVEFRKNQITSKKEESQVEAIVLDRVERYLEIEKIIGLSSVEWESPRGTPFPVNEISEAENAALILRNLWGLGMEGIPNFAELLEERAIKVLSLALPESVDGLTCCVVRKERKKIPAIVINQASTGERQRFTLAHELGHMVLKVKPGLDAEKASHRFASSFLMPADELLSEIGNHRRSISLGELIRLKPLFGVSAQAIAYRCKDLGIINSASFHRLFETFKELGYRDPPYAEPAPVEKENPQRFERLCFRALTEGAISESKAAELLGLTVRKLNEAMDRPPKQKIA